jgi:hypothetical protein
MRAFGSSLLTARSLLADDRAWLWFVELPRKSGGVYRLVDNTRKVTANSKLWVPTSLKIEVPAENSDGSIAELAITLPNVARIAVAELEAGEIQGQIITLRAEHQLADGTFGAFTNTLRWRARVIKATATEQVVQISAGHPASLQRLPLRVFDPSVAPIFATRSGGGVL